MNKKHISIFLAVTVIVVIAAVVAVNQQQSTVVNQQAGDYLFPGLESKVNDIAKIEIVKGEDRLTLQRSDNNWQILEKDNYPADFSKIKESIMKIAAFTTLEAKTKIPDNYGKLNVEDPTQEDAKSILVSIKDATDTELAAVIVGRMEAGSFTTVGQDKTYVRKANDDQVWLVKGGLVVDEAAGDWVVEEILNIDSSRVKQVTITHNGGDTVVIQKDKPGEGDFVIANLPKDKQVDSQSNLVQVARAMETLRMLDVEKSEGFEFPEGKTITTELQTFDGLVITAKTVKQAGDYLTNFTVRFDESLRPAEETKAEQTRKEGEETQNASTAPDPHAPQPSTIKDAALTQQEATQLNQQLSPWVFTLNKTKAKNLVKEMEDLVKDKS
ncbi:DUF4340 domain-containing protein [Kaarinaea lacus]